MNNYFWPDKYKMTHKGHQCDACAASIEIGEVYIYQKGVYDGDFFSRHLHPACRDIWFTSLEDEELGDYEESLLWWLIRHLGDVEGRECYDESRAQRKARRVK